MKKIVLMLGILMVFACGTSSWASLMSGSLSTPILYDSTAYGIQPQSNRPMAANIPGGLVATAAWYDFGMRLDWTVTKNADNTYTYHYLFGPGWYPESNPSSGSGLDPYVTNKNITAFDIQLGSSMTLSSFSSLTWNVYDSAKLKLGTGGLNNDGTQYWQQLNSDGTTSYSGTENTLSVKNLTGTVGYSDAKADGSKGTGHYTLNPLFHGLQWANIGDPNNAGNTLFPTGSDVNFELIFTTTYAPGLGSFFTNSTQTGANNNWSSVVAFNSSMSGYDSSKLTGTITLNNSVTVAGGTPAPVPIPPSLLLFGSGLSGLFFFRRRRSVV